MRRLKALFGLLLVVAAIYVGWKLLPPYLHNYQFEDAVESEALLNSYSNKSEWDIRTALANKAKEYDIPLTPDQINVVRNGGELSIWAEYTVHVEMPWMPVDLTFRPATKNKRI